MRLGRPDSLDLMVAAECTVMAADLVLEARQADVALAVVPTPTCRST